MIPDDELPEGESFSPAPGVVVARRSFLSIAAIALAAAPTRAAAGLRPRASSREPWTVQEFVEVVVSIAKELVTDTSIVGQDRYLLTVAAHAARLGDVPVPDKMNEVAPGKHWIGNNFAGDPFVVLHWKLAPGAVIREHPHTYGNVVTIGLAGETHVRNFEVIGEPDYEAKGPFQVQLTIDQVLCPGDINLVNLERNYIHGFKAGTAEARGLDITTRIKPKQPNVALSICNDPLDSARRIYEARWE